MILVILVVILPKYNIFLLSVDYDNILYILKIIAYNIIL